MDGYYLAEDTGNGVKGNIIDIFIGEDKPGENKLEKFSDEFACQKIKVQLLEKGTGKIDQRYVTASNRGDTKFTPYWKTEDDANNAEDEQQESTSLYSKLYGI